MHLLVVFLTALLSAAALAQETPAPESWYRDGYAPLWANNPGKNIDAMLGYYAGSVTTHEAEGPITRSDSDSWLREPMKEWLADGWLKAELQKLSVDQLNASTVVFKASWLDSYEGGATEVSCGWYLADLIEGSWQFTAYADIDCAAHGL